MDQLVYFYLEGHQRHFERDHPESPERVETIKTALIEYDLWERFPHLPPLELSEELIQSIHSPRYLNTLELTCKRGGHLDPDTYTTPASWELAHLAAGGAAAVAAAVWEGKARRGFALTRPPGHHAVPGQGMGFCLLNNIAIAAEYLLKNYPVEKLAIIDLDLHHGNGTQEIFWSRRDVFYVSTHQYPEYPGTGDVSDTGNGAGLGWTANFPLPPLSGDAAFLTVMDKLILPLLDQKAPQMILVSYGFDPHWKDPLGQLLLTAQTYGRMVQMLSNWADDHCGGRLALILEGGYDLSAAKACSLAVVSAMLGLEYSDPLPCPYEENPAWMAMVKRASAIWGL